MKPFLKSSVWFDEGIEPRPTGCKADTLNHYTAASEKSHLIPGIESHLIPGIKTHLIQGVTTRPTNNQ